MTEKDAIVTSLKTAHAELERALDGLARLPSTDVNRVRYAAHMLNNYLTVTAGTIALLQARLEASPDEELVIWLNSLQHATTLMTHTTLALLNAAPVERANLRPEKFNLPTLVRRVCDYYATVATRKQIAVHFQADVQSPFVRADRVAVAAVLDNLLSNAIKFSPHGKGVWVRVSAEPGYLVSSVRDDGPGLTPEDQERLFQPGVRLSNVPTDGEPSTGYGLAVAKDLIDKLGGTIWCVSQPGSGASFAFRLPAFAE
jgi:signal transduction histidine kinase